MEVGITKNKSLINNFLYNTSLILYKFLIKGCVIAEKKETAMACIELINWYLPICSLLKCKDENNWSNFKFNNPTIESKKKGKCLFNCRFSEEICKFLSKIFFELNT
jgi:hypothetical protein